jgi:predicted O-methyltransferase YrrM
MTSIAPKLGERINRVLTRLYAEDHEQRRLGLPTEQRTRNIDIESGRFLFVLALGMQAQQVLEIGSSNGVSTIWWAAAMARTGGFVHGTEIIPERAAEANRNLAEAGVSDFGKVHQVAAGDPVLSLEGVDLIFIDAEKDDYTEHFERTVRLLRPGGLIVADNVVSHDCSVFQAHLRSRPDIETVTVPIERGMEISVKL